MEKVVDKISIDGKMISTKVSRLTILMIEIIRKNTEQIQNILKSLTVLSSDNVDIKIMQKNTESIDVNPYDNFLVSYVGTLRQIMERINLESTNVSSLEQNTFDDYLDILTDMSREKRMIIEIKPVLLKYLNRYMNLLDIYEQYIMKKKVMYGVSSIIMDIHQCSVCMIDVASCLSVCSLSHSKVHLIITAMKRWIKMLTEENIVNEIDNRKLKIVSMYLGVVIKHFSSTEKIDQIIDLHTIYCCNILCDRYADINNVDINNADINSVDINLFETDIQNILKDVEKYEIEFMKNMINEKQTGIINILRETTDVLQFLKKEYDFKGNLSGDVIKNMSTFKLLKLIDKCQL